MAGKLYFTDASDVYGTAPFSYDFNITGGGFSSKNMHVAIFDDKNKRISNVGQLDDFGKVTLTASFSKQGTFIIHGYPTDSKGYVLDYSLGTGSRTVYVQAPKSVTVIYHAGQNTDIVGPEEQITIRGTSDSDTQWNFRGWASKQNSAKISYKKGDVIIGESGGKTVDLYAVFSRRYSITCYYGLKQSNNTIVYSNQYRYNNSNDVYSYNIFDNTSAPSKKNNITFKGMSWDHIGWKKSSSANGSGIISNGRDFSVSTGMELYAIYQKSGLGFIYNKNSNDSAITGSIPTVTGSAYYNTSGNSVGFNTQTASSSNYKVEGEKYFFKHWNTKSDNSGTSYGEGESVTTYYLTTLYAIWELNYFNGVEDVVITDSQVKGILKFKNLFSSPESYRCAYTLFKETSPGSEEYISTGSTGIEPLSKRYAIQFNFQNLEPGTNYKIQFVIQDTFGQDLGPVLETAPFPTLKRLILGDFDFKGSSFNSDVDPKNEDLAQVKIKVKIKIIGNRNDGEPQNFTIIGQFICGGKDYQVNQSVFVSKDGSNSYTFIFPGLPPKTRWEIDLQLKDSNGNTVSSKNFYYYGMTIDVSVPQPWNWISPVRQFGIINNITTISQNNYKAAFLTAKEWFDKEEKKGFINRIEKTAKYYNKTINNVTFQKATEGVAAGKEMTLVQINAAIDLIQAISPQVSLPSKVNKDETVKAQTFLDLAKALNSLIPNN